MSLLFIYCQTKLKKAVIFTLVSLRRRAGLLVAVTIPSTSIDIVTSSCQNPRTESCCPQQHILLISGNVNYVLPRLEFTVTLERLTTEA